MRCWLGNQKQEWFIYHELPIILFVANSEVWNSGDQIKYFHFCSADLLRETFAAIITCKKSRTNRSSVGILFSKGSRVSGVGNVIPRKNSFVLNTCICLGVRSPEIINGFCIRTYKPWNENVCSVSIRHYLFLYEWLLPSFKMFQAKLINSEGKNNMSFKQLARTFSVKYLLWVLPQIKSIFFFLLKKSI